MNAGSSSTSSSGSRFHVGLLPFMRWCSAWISSLSRASVRFSFLITSTIWRVLKTCLTAPWRAMHRVESSKIMPCWAISAMYLWYSSRNSFQVIRVGLKRRPVNLDQLSRASESCFWANCFSRCLNLSLANGMTSTASWSPRSSDRTMRSPATWSSSMYSR